MQRKNKSLQCNMKNNKFVNAPVLRINLNMKWLQLKLKKVFQM